MNTVEVTIHPDVTGSVDYEVVSTASGVSLVPIVRRGGDPWRVPRSWVAELVAGRIIEHP
jgi:hypothetical protein